MVKFKWTLLQSHSFVVCGRELQQHLPVVGFFNEDWIPVTL